MKHVFILNPQAGFKKTEKQKALIRRVYGDGAIIRMTEHEGHATQIAKEYDGAVIFAVGGDGTANETMCGTVGTQNPLCVIPAGSGNDFVRSLYTSIPQKKRTAENVLSQSPQMVPHAVDGAKVNDTYFMNIASFGFDAEVVRNSERYENLPGMRKFSYILAMFYTIFHYHGTELEVEIDGTLYRQKALLCCVANGQYYGGGIRIAPEAKLDDGKLDAYLIDAISPWRFLTLLPKLAKGTHTATKYVKHFSAEHIVIRGKDLTLNVDGELSPADTAEFRVLPGQLLMMVPKEET